VGWRAASRPNVVDGLGGERATVGSAAVDQVCVEPIKVFGPERCELQIADDGCDVVADPLVAFRRRRSEFATTTRHPRLEQERPDGESRCRAIATRLFVGRQAGDDRFGILAVTTSRMPASAMLSGYRVDAVVGDHVEAVVALDDVGHVELFGFDWFVRQPEEEARPPDPGTCLSSH
jgi:hypothetical protein